MAKRETDIAAMLGAQLAKVSESDTGGREQIEYIDLDLLDPDPRNFYNLPGIPELAENIRLVGLQQPLRVRPKESGHFEIVTGHRRHRALLRLAKEEGLEQFAQVPCIRERTGESSAMERIRLICGNCDNRTMSSAELAQQAEALEAALLALKKEGFEFSGRTREKVAQLLQVSETKIANAKVIKNGLKLPRFSLLWKQDEITESCALEIARLDEKTQQRLATWLDHEEEPCTLRNVREFSVISCMIDHDCQLAKAPCPNARDMYEAFFRNGNWEGCCGCCASCNRRDTCEEACEFVVQAEPEEVRVEGKSSAPAPQTPWSPKTWRESRDLLSSRLRQEREKTGLDRQAFADKIGEHKATYSAWENGSLPGADRLPKLAVTLGVSTDYLYGLTDDPAPRSAMPQGQLTICGWMPGSTTPAEPGDFAVLADFGAGYLVREFYSWDGENWIFTGGEAEDLPSWWLRLPPEPGKGADHG